MPFYNEICHIPLMAYHPDFAHCAGERRHALTQNIDIMPTLLEMNGVEIPEHVDGHSLLPVLERDEGHLVGEALAPDLRDRPSLDPAVLVVGDGLLLDLDHHPGPAVEQRLAEKYPNHRKMRYGMVAKGPGGATLTVNHQGGCGIGYANPKHAREIDQEFEAWLRGRTSPGTDVLDQL